MGQVGAEAPADDDMLSSAQSHRAEPIPEPGQMVSGKKAWMASSSFLRMDPWVLSRPPNLNDFFTKKTALQAT